MHTLHWFLKDDPQLVSSAKARSRETTSPSHNHNPNHTLILSLSLSLSLSPTPFPVPSPAQVAPSPPKNKTLLAEHHSVTTVARPWFRRGTSNLARKCDPPRTGSGLRPRLEDSRPVRTTHSCAWSSVSRTPLEPVVFSEKSQKQTRGNARPTRAPAPSNEVVTKHERARVGVFDDHDPRPTFDSPATATRAPLVASAG